MSTSKLPELPKQHKTKEADFGVVFRHWLNKNYKNYESASFELKDTRGRNTFNLSEFKAEQRASALANKSEKGNLIRVTMGTPGAADYIYLRQSYAFVVIKYPKFFAICDAEDLIKHKGKSISGQHVDNIALTIVKM